MNWLFLQTVAQVSVERVLNVLPEGFLIAFFAWVVLRLLRGKRAGWQNAGTRFAVWFLALLALAVLPVLGGARFLAASAGISSEVRKAAIAIPAQWATFAFLAWCLGAGIGMLYLAIGLCRICQLRRTCAPVNAEELDPAIRTTLAALGAWASTDAITLAKSEHIRVPAAIGFFKRTIVFPAWVLRELPPNDLNVILLHEFAHLRRGDGWTNLIQKIVRALFFFHPAVWWIERQLSLEREMACDEAVLAHTGNPHGYATCLVSLLEKSLAHRLTGERWSMAHAAVHRAREASLRLARILDSNHPVATRIWKPAVGMVSAFAILCLLALPVAPQLVSFDVGNTGRDLYSNTGRISPVTVVASAAVIPAVLHSGPPSISVTARTAPMRAPLRARPVTKGDDSTSASVSRQPSAVPQVRPRSERLELGTGRSAPLVQTVVFIESTQQGSHMWSIEVWRVTFIKAVEVRKARMPAAKAI